jgi:hypothetical protein
MWFPDGASRNRRLHTQAEMAPKRKPVDRRPEVIRVLLPYNILILNIFCVAAGFFLKR